MPVTMQQQQQQQQYFLRYCFLFFYEQVLFIASLLIAYCFTQYILFAWYCFFHTDGMQEI